MQTVEFWLATLTHWHMRPRVEWMVRPVDDLILDMLSESGLTLSPRVIAVNIDYGRSYVGKRVRSLSDHGLAERVDEGLYRITDLGEEYVAGNLSADDLEEE